MSVSASSAATSQRRLGELSEVCARATNDQQLFEDVSNRLRELVAKLFAEHYYPAIHALGGYEHVEVSA